MMPAAPLVGAVTTRPPRCVFLVDRQRVQIDPVQRADRYARRLWRYFADKLPIKIGGAAFHFHAAGHHAFLMQAAFDTSLHHLPDVQQIVPYLLFAQPCLFIAHHQSADRLTMRCHKF